MVKNWFCCRMFSWQSSKSIRSVSVWLDKAYVICNIFKHTMLCLISEMHFVHIYLFFFHLCKKTNNIKTIFFIHFINLNVIFSKRIPISLYRISPCFPIADFTFKMCFFYVDFFSSYRIKLINRSVYHSDNYSINASTNDTNKKKNCVINFTLTGHRHFVYAIMKYEYH